MEREKCTKQYVQTAAKNAMSPSNQKKEDQFTAEIATKNTEHQDFNNVLNLVFSNLFLFLFYFQKTTFINLLKFSDMKGEFRNEL